MEKFIVRKPYKGQPSELIIERRDSFEYLFRIYITEGTRIKRFNENLGVDVESIQPKITNIVISLN